MRWSIPILLIKNKASFVKKLIDKENGAIVVAHPYRRNYSEYRDINEVNYKKMLNKASKNPVFKLSDAIEEFNGKGSKKENKFSSDLTKKLKMNGTGASDAHQIEHIGTFATEFFNPIQNIKDLIKGLSENNDKIRKCNYQINEKNLSYSSWRYDWCWEN